MANAKFKKKRQKEKKKNKLNTHILEVNLKEKHWRSAAFGT
jgi:hypothetical protein